jgi:hypothetical protein
MQELTDGQLLRQFTAGNASAFGELVARHMPMVYRAAARQVGQDLAEDVAQGVFLVLAQKARHVHGEMSPDGWSGPPGWRRSPPGVQSAAAGFTRNAPCSNVH